MSAMQVTLSFFRRRLSSAQNYWVVFVFINGCKGGNQKPVTTKGASQAVPSASSALVASLPAAPRENVRELSASFQRTCAVLENGGLRCWGHKIVRRSRCKKLSEPPFMDCEFFETAESTRPEAVAGVNEVAEVASGDDHICVRRNDGSVMCWGENSVGQVGAQVSDTCVVDPCALSPVDVQISAVADVSAG